MNKNKFKKLRQKVFLRIPLGFFFFVFILSMCAGTIKYWQAWLFSFVIFTPVVFLVSYFLKKSPEFLERRMKFKEKEKSQTKMIKLLNLIFFLGFLIPGLDYRFGWSNVSIWLVLFSNIIFLAGFYLVFLSFKENVFAGRTVEKFKGQKVIESGPYAVIRHPMYAGIIPMFLSMPLALGSFWSVIFFVLISIIVVFRALNEEEVLKRDLPGYKKYCMKVKYRLIPYLW